jgi:hypothetical protein
MSKQDMMDKLLSFDSLAEAERISGESCKTPGIVGDAVTMLGMQLALTHNEIKNAALAENDDTLFSDTLAHYLSVVQSLGFVKLYEEDFADEGTPEKSFVFWRMDGFLLWVDTYSKWYAEPQVNTAKLYYNLRLGKNERFTGLTASGGYAPGTLKNGAGIWAGDHDVRKALRHTVTKLAPYALAQWVGSSFLWLVNYAQPKVPGYNCRAINTAILDKCGEVGAMIKRAMK